MLLKNDCKCQLPFIISREGNPALKLPESLLYFQCSYTVIYFFCSTSEPLLPCCSQSMFLEFSSTSNELFNAVSPVPCSTHWSRGSSVGSSSLEPACSEAVLQTRLSI
ncbi:hypothetical protein DV515_00014102 [Chloebia gouldiae]|uniref:Uncharacterized protein n=1 Tax=Chloebia gouldiae TaxID=44316 RepID=A0A3L8S083_CHLGU|nr:hypothetical protein DV515_00014102 [Chloebia gouldiae]